MEKRKVEEEKDTILLFIVFLAVILIFSGALILVH
jgi:hypothetical protein